MTGRDQARLLGLFFWIFTGFQILIIAFIAIIYFVVFGAIIASVPHKPGEPGPEVILPILLVVMVIIGIMTAIFSIPKVVAGFGLRNEKSWARIWAIIACCMAVLSFPLGTALGVWGLIFLLGDDGKRYFENPSYGRLGVGSNSMASPPPPNSWQ